MTRNWMKKWIAALGTALALAVAFAYIASAQPLATQIAPGDAEKVRAIASALSARPDRVDAVLKALKFSKVSDTISGFSEWPALRKVETAYLSAVQAGGATEGENFLRAVSTTVAEDYSNAIRYESALKPYFERTAAAARISEIKFGALVGEPGVVDARVRSAILAIERYVDRVPGGMRWSMAACCGLDRAQVYDVLRASPSRFAALAQAIEKGRIPPELREKLLRLAKMVADSTHAVAYDAAFQKVLRDLQLAQGASNETGKPPAQEGLNAEQEQRIKDIVAEAGRATGADNAAVAKLVDAGSGQSQAGKPDNPGAPAVGPSGPTDPSKPPNGGDGGGGPPEDKSTHNLNRYNGVHRSVDSSPGVRSGAPSPSTGAPRFKFEMMRTSARGFGGVVFGSTVSSKLNPPERLIWVPDGLSSSASASGQFAVVLKGGEVVLTRTLYADDGYAAWEILTGRKAEFSALDVANDEGVGLASVGPDRERTMVVHPALFGLAAGDAAVLADAIGFRMDIPAFERQLMRAGLDAEIIFTASAWRSAPRGFYKIIDVPLEIEIRDGLIRARRSDDKYHENLRPSGYLSFQALDDDGAALDEEATPFYQILPGLIAAFPAFERLNAFAETFAILRWARLSNAEIVPPPVPKVGDAGLFIHTLGDGSLLQTSHSLTPKDLAAANLSVLRTAADETSKKLQELSVPPTVLAVPKEIEQTVRDVVLLGLAEGDVRTAAQRAPDLETSSAAVLSKLDDQQDSLSVKFADLTRSDFLLAKVISKEDAQLLDNLRRRVRGAADAGWQAVAESSKADDTVRRQISRLPKSKSNDVEQLYNELVEDWIQRSVAKAAAKKSIDARLAQLRGSLQAVLPRDSIAALWKAFLKQESTDLAARKAATEYKEAVRAKTPEWFKTAWPHVEDLAKIGENIMLTIW